MKIKIVDPRPAEKHGLLTETMASRGLKKRAKGWAVTGRKKVGGQALTIAFKNARRIYRLAVRHWACPRQIKKRKHG